MNTKNKRPSRLTHGEIENYNLSEEEYRNIFNKVFTSSSLKMGTYKFVFLKSILDNLNNVKITEKGAFISYIDIFNKFTENYWNVVMHEKLRQSKDTKRCHYSRLEIIFMNAAQTYPDLEHVDFNSVDSNILKHITNTVRTQCKTCVIGSLYQDLEKNVYSFNLKGLGITLAPKAYEFLNKNKVTIKDKDISAWANFLAALNPNTNIETIIKILNKQFSFTYYC